MSRSEEVRGFGRLDSCQTGWGATPHVTTASESRVRTTYRLVNPRHFRFSGVEIGTALPHLSVADRTPT